MKKFGLLCLALVLALGALGVGYAAWTDTIYIDGTVNTGKVCLEFEDGTFGEINQCQDSINNPGEPADMNWAGWVPQTGAISCPPEHKFVSKFCEDKDVASIECIPKDNDGDTYWDELEITVNDAYPHFLGWVTFEVCNCGTIPVKLQAPVINQSPFLVIEYRNGVGAQLHPGQCHEVSLFVGVVQHQGYWDGDVWVVDDESMPLTPENTPLRFTITVEGIQWNEY